MFTVKGISHCGEVTILEARKVRIERYDDGHHVRLFDDRSDEWFYQFVVMEASEVTGDPAKVASVVVENASGKTSEIVRAG